MVVPFTHTRFQRAIVPLAHVLSIVSDGVHHGLEILNDLHSHNIRIFDLSQATWVCDMIMLSDPVGPCPFSPEPPALGD